MEQLAMDLWAVGHHEEAVQTGEEFTGLRRKLVEMDASAHSTTDLICSLYYLGVFLRTVDRQGDALRADEEVAQLRHKLPETEMGPVLALHLCLALRKSCGQLMLLGHHKEAIQFAEDLVGISRKLPATEPAFKIDLPSSLAMLATTLGKVHRYEDALCIDAEAVELLREQRKTNPPSTTKFVRPFACLSGPWVVMTKHYAWMKKESSFAEGRQRCAPPQMTISPAR
jgi:hypothetical protein